MIGVISPQFPKYISGAITSTKTKPIPLIEMEKDACFECLNVVIAIQLQLMNN